MAALVEGQQFGLSSKGNSHDNKTRIFMKLTDSALKAIEEFLSIRNQTAKHPTIQFVRNQGVIKFPSTQNSSSEHSFNFSLSSTADIEGPQGRYECIQQCGSRSLESLGSMQYKMQIHAKEDVYEATKHRMAVAEEESKKNCTKVIKASGPYVGRKVKVKKHNLVIPPKPSSPPYNSKPVSSVPHSKVNGVNGHMGNHPTNGFVSQVNKNSPNQKAGNPEIMKKPIRDRIIHLLALRPYKKPELLARLMKDGVRDKDKHSVTSILSQVANMKENTYTIAKHAWSEVQEDWPFYSDSDRQLLKRRISQNATAEGDSPSNSQPSCSPNPAAQKRIGGIESEPAPAKRQRISHFTNGCSTGGSKPELLYNGHATKSDSTASHKPDSSFQNGYHKSNDTHHLSSPVNSRTEFNGFNGSHSHKNDKVESNGFSHVNGGSGHKRESNGHLEGGCGHKRESNGHVDHLSHKAELNGFGLAPNNNHVGNIHSNGNANRVSSSSINIVSRMTPLPSPDSQESNEFRGLTNGMSNGDCISPEHSPLGYEEYIKKYTEITNAEQRAHYKADFNSEYNEYRDLHAVVDRVSRRFSTLKESLRNVDEGTEDWQKIKDQIVREYMEMKRDHKYQDAKRKFQYMHDKLAHIKRLVLEYDQYYAMEL